MIDRRTKSGLLQVAGFLVGGLTIAVGAGAVIVWLAPLWGPAKWMDIAWLQAGYLFLALAGGYLGLEAVSAIAHVARPGAWSTRATVFLSVFALASIWIALSRTGIWPRGEVGFAVSLCGLVSLGIALRIVAGRLGVWGGL